MKNLSKVDSGRSQRDPLGPHETGGHVREIPTQAEGLQAGKTVEVQGAVEVARPVSHEVGEHLVSRGALTAAQLRWARVECGGDERTLLQLLIRAGLVHEDTWYRTLAEIRGCGFWTFDSSQVDLQASRIIPTRFAEAYQVLALQIDPGRKMLVVAMSDPDNLTVSDLLRRMCRPLGLGLRLVVASPASIRRGIDHSNKASESVGSAPDIETAAPRGPSRADLVGGSDTPEIKRVVNDILYEAAVEGASDVHIENLESRVQVRFRIDGILQPRETALNKDNIEKVTSVLKIEAGLDITERRRPLDGVFRKRIGEDWFIDFRVHLHRSQFGSDAVIRILDRTRRLPALDQLGLPPDILERYLKLIASPQGLILITGPTGSGKSTTLYSTLNYLNTPERKIVTAEDPVEYHLDGICQYQVNDAIGNSFSEYARRFLRKDPDIILIGETRDEITAAACLRAAMTGHLVFSTLHTNHTTSAVSRLRDLKSDSSSIGESLLAVLAQRLVRAVCSQCRQPYEPAVSYREIFEQEFPNLPASPFLRGVGCDFCHQTGYSGRIGVFELWQLDAEGRKAILDGRDEWSLAVSARNAGARPLILDAFSKVRAGITTVEEIFRVVPMADGLSRRPQDGRKEVP